MLRRLSSLFDNAREKEKDDGADGSDQNRTDEATTTRRTKRAEQESTQHCAEHAHDDVAQDSESTTLDELAGKPAGYQADQDEPYECHTALLSFRDARSHATPGNARRAMHQSA